jgi:hypothetical protein
MNANRMFGHACLLLALAASTAPAQKHDKKSKKGADGVEFTSSCVCTACQGKHRWDEKIDKSPAPTSVAADHHITPSELRTWAGPGGKIGKSTPRSGKETEFFTLTGEIRYARLEDDGDIHLQLADQGKGKNAKTASVEIPMGEPWCAIRQQIFGLLNVTLPAQFSKHKNVSPKSNTVISVTGKAFYDAENDGGDTRANDRTGAGSSQTTVWEIHPVMKLAVGGK